MVVVTLSAYCGGLGPNTAIVYQMWWHFGQMHLHMCSYF